MAASASATGPSTTPTGHRRPLWVRLLLGLAILLAVLALVLAFFPWDLLRGPLNRYVSEKTGRHFEITRRLDVKLGLTPRILADGIEFANPDWAQDRFLVKADSAQVAIRLLPLLRKELVIPLIILRKPELGLQMEPDGRRTWALGRDTSDAKTVPEIGQLIVDEGSVHFIAREHGADITTRFAIDPHVADQMPLSYQAKGTWQKESFSAQGRTGNVLHLSKSMAEPFPLELSATAGRTSLKAKGSVASLASLDGANASFNLQGANLGDLYKLLGVVLPETPRYALRGNVTKDGEIWRVKQIDGRLGNSDLSGELNFDKADKVPHLTGKLASKVLDFDDLAPVVGLPEQPRSKGVTAGEDERVNSKNLPVRAAPPKPTRQAKADKPPRDPSRKVLPTAPLDVARLNAMNADVWFNAASITHVKQLPLDRMNAHIVLDKGVLRLDPLDLGVAGGQLKGSLQVSSRDKPAAAQVKLQGQGLQLNKLFPTVESTRSSFGRIDGKIDLAGRGNTVAQMLGGASGDVSFLMGQGRVSNILLEFLGLDGGEIIKFLVRGDETIELRCAATAFDVKQGLMTSRAFVLDSVDTVVWGSGTVSLAHETLDLRLKPQPKDTSILSLRTPLRIGGTFGAPQAGPEKGPLIARAGAALALGAINPLLALAATIETGPGKDANCGEVLAKAAQPGGAPAQVAKNGSTAAVMGAR